MIARIIASMNSLTGSARAKVLPESVSYSEMISLVIVSGSLSANEMSGRFENNSDLAIINHIPRIKFLGGRFMNSNDFVIRTERSVIDVVLSNEGKIDALRRDFEDFKQETSQEFKNVRQEMKEGLASVRQEMADFKREHNEQYIILTSNQQILSNKIDALKDSLGLMQNIFTWGFAAVAIGVAIAPIIKGWVEGWKDKSLSERISNLEAQIKDLQALTKGSD